MKKIRIPKEEFSERINKIKTEMRMKDLQAILVYGDEYRKENLRYVSNFWPIFERGALLLGIESDPVVLCAPEGEKVAEEMSVWEDIRLLPEFECVTVPDAIDYPLAHYTSLKTLSEELNRATKIHRLGIAGMDAMPAGLLEKIESAFACEVVSANEILFKLRLTKSENELACLREAARMADAGARAVLNADIIGLTELQAAAIGEYEIRKAGAEQIIFTLFSSGDRTHTIVGRPSGKVIEDGDMIQCGFAVQYEGYVATVEVPFAVGNFSEDTRRVIDILVKALEAGRPCLKAGEPMRSFVRAVKGVYRQEGVEEYDVYPPLHGIGCAEAESPYPDAEETRPFEAGMAANTDISLFGMKGGSNRIEEGYIITCDGAESLSPFVRGYCENWMRGNS